MTASEKPKRSLLEYTRVSADLRETNILLARIASALEQILLHQYGYVTEPSKPSREEGATADYTDEMDALKEELLAAHRGTPTDTPVEG